MSILNRLKLGGIIIFVSSCSTESSRNHLRYFSINDVLIEQERVLNKLNPEVNKKVVYNDLEEERPLHNIDWKKELELFHKYELNTTQYAGAFQIDTSLMELKGMKIKYSPIENSNLKTYIIQKDSIDRIQEIDIYEEKNNFFFKSRVNVNMVFGLYSETFPILKLYRIESKKEIWLLGKDELSIDVVIRN